MIQKIAILACGLLLVGARPGSAQILQWQDRGFLNVNIGGQGKSNDFTTSLSRDLYEEVATVETSQSHGGSAFFDLSGGYRVWNNVAVGMSFARRSADADGTYSASIPDPIAFNQPRIVSGSIPGLQRRETFIGIPVTYVIPVTDKVDVMAFVGPSYGKLAQDMVTNTTIAEGPSGPTVTISQETVKASAWGYTLGVDVRWLLSKQVGVGGFMRFQAADGDLTSTEKMDMGGFQFGGGLRVRF